MRPWAATPVALMAAAVSVLVTRPLVGQANDHTSITPQVARTQLRLYLDCAAGLVCDGDYLRTTLNAIAFVRDPSGADVDVILTEEATGSGGRSLTGRFIGRYAFAGLTDTLRIATDRDATDDEQRRAIERLLRVGLVRFAAHTSLIDYLGVSFDSARPSANHTVERDAWNSWVFGVSLAGQLGGEQYTESAQLTAGLTADRVTRAWKFDLAVNENYNYSNVHQDSVSATTILHSFYANGLIAKALTGHWSAGLVSSVAAAAYSNERFVFHAAPAVEYDVFPYSDASHHQLILLYAVGGTSFRYIDRTIFDRRSEIRPDHALTVALGVTEPWGGMSGSLQGAAFLDDMRQNRAVLSGDCHVRLFTGFSFNIDPSISSIHDQIYLPAGGVSPQDILLARRQLATSYQYSMTVGFTFSFGSIFNTVVNPRFARTTMAGSQ